MRIIANELKKIWRVKILAIIFFLCAAYFMLFMNHYIVWYPRGTWGGGVDFAHHLTENYGATLSQEDFEDFLTYREVIASEMDLFIASNPVFAEAGIHDFQSYEAFRVDSDYRYETLNESERSLRYALFLELGFIVRSEFIREGETVDLTSDNETPIAYLRIFNFDAMVGRYQMNILGETEWDSWIDSFMEYAPLSERELQRLIEIRDSGELLNIMPQPTTEQTQEYARSLAVLVIFVTLILVSPLITTDRANKVNRLQYSSRQGRNILKKQFTAIIISAVIMTTMLVIVFAGVFGISTEVHAFWNNGINSFLSGAFHWLSITFGQYVLLLIGLIYLLSIGTAAFAFVLSRFSQNMIKLLFKIIPLFIATILLSNWILTDFLVIYFGSNVHMQMLSLVFSLIAGVVIAIIILHRERRVELI